MISFLKKYWLGILVFILVCIIAYLAYKTQRLTKKLDAVKVENIDHKSEALLVKISDLNKQVKDIEAEKDSSKAREKILQAELDKYKKFIAGVNKRNNEKLAVVDNMPGDSLDSFMSKRGYTPRVIRIKR